MRTILTILFLATLCKVVAEEPMAEASVTLPYPELRALIESAKKPEAVKPPIPFSIISTKVTLVPGEASAQGTITFDVQTFLEESQLIPLISDAVSIHLVESAEASVVVKNGFYCLFVDGRKRQRLTLHIGWPGKIEGESLALQCGISPAVVSDLEISQLPNGLTAEISGAIRDEKSGTWHLGQLDKLDIHIRKHRDEPLGTVVPMPAIVREARSVMRIVRDGTFFNATTWRIQHNSALTWRMRLDEGFQVVSCMVGGSPSIPILVDAHTLEIYVPEQGSNTTVELSYTGKAMPFEAIRGDFSIALPSTDLLVEKSDWTLALPTAFGPVAVEGNCEFSPGNSSNELQLRKELCRGEAPSVRVFYQKSETNKNP